jgi:hypothetical protein
MIAEALSRGVVLDVHAQRLVDLKSLADAGVEHA